jgi:hypothetical protein
VHGIEIKKFKVDKKVPRGGDPITIEFVASTAGEFPILCSEYCGDGHEDMKGMLVVAAKSKMTIMPNTRLFHLVLSLGHRREPRAIGGCSNERELGVDNGGDRGPGRRSGSRSE